MPIIFIIKYQILKINFIKNDTFLTSLGRMMDKNLSPIFYIFTR
jgi:hypothetical protein